MTSVESGPKTEMMSVSVRDQLDRRFTRMGRLRLRRWGIAVVLSLLPVIGAFELYFQFQYGTLAWWSPPNRLAYCGLSYERVPAKDASLPPRWTDLVKVTSIPPLFGQVLSLHSDLHAMGRCADPLFYRSGSGELIEYAYPTA